MTTPTFQIIVYIAFEPQPTIISQKKKMDLGYRFPFEQEALWRQHLQEEGFVVIANWLGEGECEKYVREFWDIMEILSEGRLDRTDASTQVIGKNYPNVLHGGMIQYIGHCQPQWELRKLCKPLFQKLWGTDSLKTSFDGFCFMNGRRNYKKMENNSFLHTDQSPTKDYLWSYQGIMTLTDADENGGGFVCVPKTHKIHREYFMGKGKAGHKDNWYLFTEEEKLQEPLCHEIKVNTKAGDFILFDSRTFHCNAKPTQETLRVCTYICMLPSQKVSQKISIARAKAIDKRRTSNHHAGDGFKIFPQLPRYLENPNNFRKLVEKVNQTGVLEDPQVQALI